MHLIAMTAPTTPVERLEQISARATGFYIMLQKMD
jgi:tryptophan synthase alpha chain